MKSKDIKLFNEINRAIIKFRGTYALWSSEHGISYHELLVFYTIREYGYCTQKQICDNYLLPKQTINNVITSLRNNGILEHDETHSKGREKAFVLSAKGNAYASPFLKSLNDAESRALELLGEKKLKALITLLLEYDTALNRVLKETR